MPSVMSMTFTRLCRQQMPLLGDVLAGKLENRPRRNRMQSARTLARYAHRRTPPHNCRRSRVVKLSGADVGAA